MWGLKRGVIFKIRPLRNPSIFRNMICVPISKVPPAGMSMGPRVGLLGPPLAPGSMSSFTFHKVIFWTLAISASGRSRVHVLVASMGYVSIKILTKKINFKFQTFRVKNGLAMTRSKKPRYAQKKKLPPVEKKKFDMRTSAISTSKTNQKNLDILFPYAVKSRFKKKFGSDQNLS